MTAKSFMAYWEKNPKEKDVLVLVIEVPDVANDEPKPVALFRTVNVRAAKAWVDSQEGMFIGLFPWHSPAGPPRKTTLTRYYKKRLVARNPESFKTPPPSCSKKKPRR